MMLMMILNTEGANPKPHACRSHTAGHDTAPSAPAFGLKTRRRRRRRRRRR
jgi:hypothetical protein